MKIEGRNKSLYYLSTVVKYYRAALDAKGKERRTVIKAALKEFSRLGNRAYTTGFALGPDEKIQNYMDSRNQSRFQLVGEYGEDQKNILPTREHLYPLRVHNAIKIGDVLDAIDPKSLKKVKVTKILNHKGEESASAHGGTDRIWYLGFNHKINCWTTFRNLKL
jgi:putative protease